MSVLESAIEQIEEQQKALNQYEPAYCVGDQLKDIIRTTPAAAELVLQDLQQAGMGIKDCEKKIRAFADAHKHGNCGFCPPMEADKIIRKFYGIGNTESTGLAPELQNGSGVKVLNFADFI